MATEQRTKMDPMAAMSRAIRLTCNDYGGGPDGTIHDISDDALDSFVTIIRAFLGDLSAEQSRRKSGFYRLGAGYPSDSKALASDVKE